MQMKDSQASDSSDDSLTGLKAAVFVADAMCNSMGKKWIVNKFKGDEQVVDMWSLFVRSNGWIVKKHATKGWELTEKGKFWFKSIMSSLAAVILTLFARSAEFEVSPLTLS